MVPAGKNPRKPSEADRIRRLEEELRDSRAETAEVRRQFEDKCVEMTAFMDAVPAPVWFTKDPDSRRMEGNQAMYELLGAPLGSNVSKSGPLEESVPPYRIYKDGREIPATELPVQIAASQHKTLINFEFDLLLHDGQWRHMLGNACPLPRGSVGVFLDITDLRKAQEALRQSEERFRGLVECSPIGLAIGNEQWEIGYANPPLLDLLGYTEEDVRLGRLHWDQLTPEKFLTDDRKAVQLLKDSGTCQPYEKAFRTKEGRILPVRVGLAIINRNTDQGMVLAAFVQDLTAEKENLASLQKHQEKLQEMNALLENRVKERTAELEAKNQDLQTEIQERLRTSESLNEQKILLEAVFAQAGDGIIVVDAADQLLLNNDAAQKIIYGPLENNRPITDDAWSALREPGGRRIPKEDWPIYQALQGKNSVNQTLQLYRPDGSRLDLLVSSGPLRKTDGTLLGALAVFADISALTKAEKDREQLTRELEQKIEEMQALLEVSPVGFGVAFDQECRRISINPAFARMLGIPGRKEISGEPGKTTPFSLFFEGHALDPQHLPMRKAGLTGQEVRMENIDVVRQDGSRVSIYTFATPLRDQHGQVRGVLGTFVDVTERRRLEETARKASEELEARVQERTAELGRVNAALQRENEDRRQTEMALRKSEERFRRLVESGAFGIMLGDEYGHVSYANPLVLQMLGYSEEEVRTGKLRWDKITPLEYEQLDTKALESLRIRGRVDPYEKVYLAKNGRRIPVVLAAVLLEQQPDGSNVVAAYVLDMTLLRQAEEALRESEARLALAQKAGQVGVFDWNMLTNHVVWTEQLVEIFGIPPGSFREDYADWTRKIHPEDLPVMERLFDEWIQSGRPDSEWECRFFRPDGEIRWMMARAHILRDNAGVPVRMVGTNLDITERKRYEETLHREIVERRQIEENLKLSKELLGQRTAQLLEADRRKNEYLAMLAHELRNPLSPLRTTLELMRMHAHDGDPKMAKWFGVVNRQIIHLTRIVDDLLDTSRISRGLIELKKEFVNLPDCIREAVDNNNQLLQSQQQKIILDLPERLVIQADPVRLVQIVFNLLNNAAKYTPVRGIITLSARREGNWAVVEVADNGMGISLEVLPHIFELFYQADRSLDRAKGGLGLGLTLVQQLTQLHGGTVEAVSAGQGLGSRFTIRLPLQPVEHESRQEPARSGVPVREGQPLKILVVEDNVDSAESLGEVLQYWGYKTWLSHTGLEALQQASLVHPDVVLLDIGLPGMDGYEVSKRLHSETGLNKIKLVALSGYDERSDPNRYTEAGFDRYFTKPVNLEALEKFLQELPAGST